MKVLEKRPHGTLGALLVMAGTIIWSTALGLVPPAGASAATTKLDLTITATYACPFS
jgi:hypothetical protein